jgi:hypothetical protein
MTDEAWREFFLICARVLGKGARQAARSDSWCAWTTFRNLEECFNYWCAGLPSPEELTPSSVSDGGTWGQPFAYQEIAHMVIPRRFYWESRTGIAFEHGVKVQNIDLLSEELSRAGIPHRKTPLLLEIKLY